MDEIRLLKGSVGPHHHLWERCVKIPAQECLQLQGAMNLTYTVCLSQLTYYDKV